MKIGSITALDEVTALEVLIQPAEWDARLPADPTPMQHRIWYEACFAALYPHDQTILLTVPGGLAPFVCRNTVSTMYLAGAEELAEPGEPIYKDAAAAKQLAQAILSRKRPVRLGQPLGQTEFSEAFIAGARRSGLIVTRPTEGSPYIELDETWVSALDRFSSKRRSDFRRMQRKAEELGELTIKFHAPTSDEAGALLEQAIAVEAKGWKNRSGTAVADNPAQLAFFRDYALRAAGQGVLRIAFLHIGPDLAAVQIAAECDGAFWLFKIGYDERFARCSPGQLLMLDSIQRAAQKGLKRFEFLGKSAEWTRFWTETERPRIKLFYYPMNAVGAAALIRDLITLGVRRLRSVLTRRTV